MACEWVGGTEDFPLEQPNPTINPEIRSAVNNFRIMDCRLLWTDSVLHLAQYIGAICLH